MGSRLIARRYEVDPVFAEVSAALFGEAVDPRQFWDIAKMHDPSEVHVQGASSKRKKAALTAGLLAGTGIEALAAHETLGPLRADLQRAKPAFTAARGATGRLRALKPIGPTGAAPSRWGSGVKSGLMVGNLAVGLAAAKELKPYKSRPPVAKGLLRVKPVSTQAARDLIRARAARNARGLIAAGSLGAGGAAGYQLGAHQARQRAPQAAPTVAKSAPVEVSFRAEISKVDTDKRQVFGWCSLSTKDGQPVIDLQGDYVPIEEIEKSAYHYVINSRKGGDMHRRVKKGLTTNFDEPVHTADLVESFVVTPEKLERMGLPEDALPLGWWVGFKVNDDEQWELVKSGKRTGFSIHGSGTRKDLQ